MSSQVLVILVTSFCHLNTIKDLDNDAKASCANYMINCTINKSGYSEITEKAFNSCLFQYSKNKDNINKIYLKDSE